MDPAGFVAIGAKEASRERPPDGDRKKVTGAIVGAIRERSLAELDEAKTALETVLQAHRPYPAFAVDRHWNVVLSNSALPQLYEGCSAELLRAPVNSVRLVLHPAGMGS